MSKIQSKSTISTPFNIQANWLQNLAAKKWECIGETECVNEMAVQFSNLVNKALDETAPLKTVKIRPGYIPGLSIETKDLMHQRDLARKTISSTPGDRLIALKKYKYLRNKVTNQIRNEAKAANGKKNR